ncbi:dihydrofolate reductase family protein [Yaniella flava]|uniref:Dihydrofolate reductase family protein n=1 Tax=Yaniella flava TaxID=287930 RepID=A0ABN2U313_9MICC|nr:dihydrofolate reductase family protein [Micrococcaceae bacterium]
MTVYASISVSLDGYYVGANPSQNAPMGEAGSVLHSWFRHDVADRQQLTTHELLRDEFERLGAMIMGRDSYEHAQAVWGPHPPFEVPIFVLTNRPRSDDVREGTTFHFVTEGFETALDRAHAAAQGRDVGLHGGGAIQQALIHEVLEELQVHLVPHILQRGRRLFEQFDDRLELQQHRVVEGNGVTHIQYRVP